MLDCSWRQWSDNLSFNKWGNFLFDISEVVSSFGVTNSLYRRNNTATDGIGGSVFSFFKGLAGQKAITKEAMMPILDKMREHLCCM